MNGYYPAAGYQLPFQYGGRYNAPAMMQPSVYASYVTGREEAVAAQVAADGGLSVFADIGHGMIYTKQLNMQDGSAVFRTYRLVNDAASTEGNVGKAEFEHLKEQFVQLKSEFDGLMRQLTGTTRTAETEG